MAERVSSGEQIMDEERPAPPFSETSYGIVKRLQTIEAWRFAAARRLKTASLSILDYGCGTGDHVTYPLARRGDHVLGMDMHAPSIHEAQRRYPLPNLEFRIGHLESLIQEGSTFDLLSAVDSRRVVAGSRTQVSMPAGELADSKVGWDGQWFVIDRSARQGPHVVERYRLVPKTGQLEYEMKWSGDTEIAGMKIKRVFDRITVVPLPADPAAGPVK